MSEVEQSTWTIFEIDLLVYVNDLNLLELRLGIIVVRLLCV